MLTEAQKKLPVKHDRHGLAYIEDPITGFSHGAHPNIDETGSVRGMKKLGYWGKKDRTVRSKGYIYNIDIVAVHDELDERAAKHCRCEACRERRQEQAA